MQVAGILITISGISWVVLLKSGSQTEHEEFRVTKKGILYGLLAATGQATGLITSKLGMVNDFEPIAGNVIRMLAAFVFLWVVAGFQKEIGPTLRSVIQKPRSFFWVFFGALMGPVIGVSFSLFAVQNTPQIGVASTLMGLSPIFMLPISYFVFNERFGWKVVFGTIFAIAGVSILMIFKP